jgi:hypothetical protein
VSSKDAQEIFRKLRKAGCTITITANSHRKVVGPDGVGMVVISGSPCDYRAIQNIRRDVRRHLGIEI